MFDVDFLKYIYEKNEKKNGKLTTCFKLTLKNRRKS